MIQTATISKKDFKDMVAIDNLSFPEPWTLVDFEMILSDQNYKGVKAIVDKKLVGYMIYEVNELGTTIISLAVHKDFRRQKVATNLIFELLRTNPKTVMVLVSDAFLDAHLFFKQIGFIAVNIQKDFYGDGKDAYAFAYAQRKLRFKKNVSSKF